MITRTTKVQLLVFALITLLGCSYVGARYAQLDRLVVDDTYTVSADFADSGGIFVGAEVSYRGVPVGRVEGMQLTEHGVRVDLGIQNDVDAIPSDVDVVVANRSAVGEQYVDLQPRTDHGPYLHDRSVIAQADTRVPVAPTTLLVDLDQLVSSVNERHLRTVVSELGTAFYDSGPDLSRIINTGNSFISTANDNIDVTRRLLANTDTALSTQLAGQSAIRAFARNLHLFSGTLASSDPALRTVIDDGGRAAASLGAAGQRRHDQPRRGRAPRRTRAGARRVPVCGRGRLHGRRQGSPDRPVRRALRAGADERSAGVPPGLRDAPTRSERPEREADGHVGSLQGTAGTEQRARRPERARQQFAGGRQVRPDDPDARACAP
jgi:virulence factor Mce-like protein